MLIAHLTDEFPNYSTESPPISDLMAFYKASKVASSESCRVLSPSDVLC